MSTTSLYGRRDFLSNLSGGFTGLAPTRGFSASALQSLALYNNRFVLHFSGELGKQITLPEEAVRRILLREPTAEERAGFTAFARKNGLAALCRVLFNSNEFLFVN